MIWANQAEFVAIRLFAPFGFNESSFARAFARVFAFFVAYASMFYAFEACDACRPRWKREEVFAECYNRLQMLHVANIAKYAGNAYPASGWVEGTYSYVPVVSDCRLRSVQYFPTLFYLDVCVSVCGCGAIGESVFVLREIRTANA